MTSTTKEAPSREPPIMAKDSAVERVPAASRVRAMAATGEPDRTTQAMSHPKPAAPGHPGDVELAQQGSDPARPLLEELQRQDEDEEGEEHHENPAHVAAHRRDCIPPSAPVAREGLACDRLWRARRKAGARERRDRARGGIGNAGDSNDAGGFSACWRPRPSSRRWVRAGGLRPRARASQEARPKAAREPRPERVRSPAAGSPTSRGAAHSSCRASWPSRRAAGEAWREFLRVPSLSMGVYSLKKGAEDKQTPHKQDEVYYVSAGRAVLEVDGHPFPCDGRLGRLRARPGSASLS